MILEIAKVVLAVLYAWSWSATVQSELERDVIPRARLLR